MVFYFPFVFVITKDILSSDNNFFINLFGNNSLEINFYYEKIIFWFKKFYKFGFPLIFFGFFVSIIISIKFKKYNYIQFLILIHFIINIFLSIFYISYLRNFYYIFNIFLILASFSVIYFYNKNILFKLLTILLILFNFFYNTKIILNVKKLEKIEPLFYQLYFDDRIDIKNKILKIKNLNKKNFVFFSDFSKNYFKVYQYDFVRKNFLTNKPLLNLYNHLETKNNKFSKSVIDDFNIIKRDFYLISFTQNYNYVSSIFNNLKNSDLIDKKCSIKLPLLINEPIFRDSGSGNFNVNIYLTEFKC